MKAAFGIALTALIATGAIAATSVQHPTADTRKAVDSAIANPARADQAGDDARRKAADVLAFSGVGPRDVVVDYVPGSGYWTRLFSAAVGPKGHVYAIYPAGFAKHASEDLPPLQARGLANVTAELQATDLPVLPQPVDIFWTVQNYHDVANPNGANPGGEAALKAFNTAVFASLKHGGTYIVIDHADASGTGITGTNTKHRIDPEVVKAQVTSVGFTYVGELGALHNGADDHSLKVFDPAIRGHTDQFVYKFHKK